MSSHYYSRIPRTKRFARYEFEVVVRGIRVKIVSEPGVFSASRLDPGTRVLIENMVIEDGWRILDLGTGYGIVGIVAAKLAPNGYVIMTDVNKRAIKLARRNLEINDVRNAEVREGNLYEPVKNEVFNTIVTNPPITAGMDVVYRIIEEAPEHLERGGLLQIVARHNKGGKRIMEKMREVFGNVGVIASEGGYRVYVSRKVK